MNHDWLADRERPSFGARSAVPLSNRTAQKELSMRGFTTRMALILLTCFALPARGYATDYIWCELLDSSHSASYLSEVFAGDFSKQIAIGNAFTAYVDGNYGPTSSVGRCQFSDDLSTAKSNRDSAKATSRRIFKSVIQTNWTY